MAVKDQDMVRKKADDTRPLDRIDRKILGVLAQDATLSFADLGTRVGLSAPAVHERVKRLKADGVIKRTVAILDGAAISKPLLAFVHVDTTGWGKTKALMALTDFPEVEEIHSATGDTCLIMKVRVTSSVALEGLLARLYDTEGVRGTRTYVALSTHLERSPQAEVSAILEDAPHIR
ncbi:Lrp/AsnC family transcriptional regulator [Pseudaestuariivita rosea]|uniref:Lrp/AsnC family transcriptional regulator n=1 Tax=Pseudaestuariivita rosea TaxID=2763263 RepID=UPI001F29006F|nr:Lrp/AsnC family transcriptional regulator [Pseudaestuariivita rosea]